MAELDYKKLYEEEQKKTVVLEQRLATFEISGKAKLYYSLNRNMSDLADMLDTIQLMNVNIDDIKDKTMERLKIIWAAVKPLSETIGILGESSGITGDEKKDTANKKGSFLDKVID